MNLKIRICVLSVIVSLAGLDSAQAGSILRLSELSSDETPAGNLLAELEFSVTGSTLLLTVTNETSGQAGYDIDAIYFNGLPHIDGLTLNGVAGSTGWVIALNERADGFGVFDFALLTDSGNDPAEIPPGESLDFQFSIEGTGPFRNSDFTSQFSTIPPGSRPSLAAIKFKNGPGDDSAFGSTVIPEPTTLVLLLSGLAVATRRRIR